jgi:hypothetical protein
MELSKLIPVKTLGLLLDECAETRLNKRSRATMKGVRDQLDGIVGTLHGYKTALQNGNPAAVDAAVQEELFELGGGGRDFLDKKLVAVCF